MNDWAKRLPQAGEPSKKAVKLAAAAQAAADVRAFDTDPNVVAYRIERMRTRVDRLIWTGLVMGLAFTAANVQAFAARGAAPWSISWLIAWLLDPMVSLVLVGVLLGEQILARHEIHAMKWVRRTKWTTLVLTYAMNTWTAWTTLDFSLILLHSVPPLVVFCAAEAVTTLKHQITAAVRKAYSLAMAWWADVEVPEELPEIVPEPEESQEGARAVAVLRDFIARRALTVVPDPAPPASEAAAPVGKQAGTVPGSPAPDDGEPEFATSDAPSVAPEDGPEGHGSGQTEKQPASRKRPSRTAYQRAEKRAITFVVERARAGIETRWQDIKEQHPARSRNWCEDKLAKGQAAWAQHLASHEDAQPVRPVAELVAAESV